MTIQDLKENRNQIISTLTEKVLEENVKEVMQIMLNGVDCCDSIEELIEGSLSICRKVSKLADLVGKINELEENL